eukprot:TRINITY_DN76801_c0_g1_i1.p1 TRINITY_DN76801_c0_g1~~TRINITY_DN76801_c0_g1_i1.p1  ORF type:complete len:107 (-),score=5.54 TRINITY_DN76801_c0_g1_i1:22-342(-)
MFQTEPHILCTHFPSSQAPKLTMQKIKACVLKINFKAFKLNNGFQSKLLWYIILMASKHKKSGVTRRKWNVRPGQFWPRGNTDNPNDLAPRKCYSPQLLWCSLAGF